MIFVIGVRKSRYEKYEVLKSKDGKYYLTFDSLEEANQILAQIVSRYYDAKIFFVYSVRDPLTYDKMVWPGTDVNVKYDMSPIDRLERIFNLFLDWKVDNVNVRAFRVIAVPPTGYPPEAFMILFKYHFDSIYRRETRTIQITILFDKDEVRETSTGMRLATNGILENYTIDNDLTSWYDLTGSSPPIYVSYVSDLCLKYNVYYAREDRP